MASVKVEKRITYTLTLCEEEAKYLKEVLQNPLVDNEPQQHYDLRYNIFEALNDSLRI